jgi:hypothetical protein
MRYWLIRHGIIDMLLLQTWSLEGSPPHFLALALAAYLQERTKPPRRSVDRVIRKVADESGKVSLSAEIVRRDLNYFLAKADSIRISPDLSLSLGMLLRHVERNVSSLRRRARR